MVTLASSTGGHAGTIAEDKADKMSVIADEDASVRALPPSRRASDTSLASRMSYAAGANPNPWAKRPASLLTVATGASDLKLDRDSKRKSGATTHTEATDPDHHSQHEKEEIQSTTLQDDEEAASLKTAPTSPINETSVL